MLNVEHMIDIVGRVEFHDLGVSIVTYTVLDVKFPPHPNSGMAVFLMDLEGIACSGGSACSSGATMGSHVLRALGFHEADKASVRFSFSRYTTEGDIQLALAAASKVFAPVEAEA